MCNYDGDYSENRRGEEHCREYDKIYSLCCKLEAKTNNISKTVKLIGCLTVIIALISIALSIGNAVAGCGCKHMGDCDCANRCLSGWGVAALALGIISAMLSAMVAFIGISNDVSKEQVFGAKKNVESMPENVIHNRIDKKKYFDIMKKACYGLTFFFSLFAAIFSFILLLWHA